jgi:hypothetical protein
LAALLLGISAFLSLAERRIAGRTALVGLLAIWSFYLPLVTAAIETKVNDQRLTLRVLTWTPSSEPLTVSNLSGKSRPDTRLTEADIEQLRQAGVTGAVANYVVNNYGNGGKSSRAIIVIQNPVSVPVEFPEPDGATDVYVQHGNTWQKYPANAPILKRIIRIETIWDDPKQTVVRVELSDGSAPGFGVWWPELELRRP